MKKSTHTAEYRAIQQELKRARRDAGLTQRGLSLKLRVPPSWIAKVELGERRIDVIEFCWFMGACGANPGVALNRAVWGAKGKSGGARRSKAS